MSIDKMIDEVIKSYTHHEVEITDKVIERYSNKRTSYNLSRKLILIPLIVLCIVTTVFASGLIVFNQDGTVSLFSEKNKKWVVVNDRKDPLTVYERSQSKRLYDFLRDLEIENGNTAIGYLKYDDDKEPFIQAYTPSKIIKFFDIDEYFNLNNECEYLAEIYDKMPEIYTFYTVEISYDSFVFPIEEREQRAREKAVFGEVVYEIIPSNNEVSYIALEYSARDGTGGQYDASFDVWISEGESSMMTSGELENEEIIDLKYSQAYITYKKNGSYSSYSMYTVLGERNVVIHTSDVIMTIEEASDLMNRICNILNNY